MTPPQPIGKDKAREGVEKAIERARQASPSGTLMQSNKTGGTVGRSGVAGSQQASGNPGNTQIVVDSSTGKSAIVKSTPENLKAIEEGRKAEVARREVEKRQEMEKEAQNRIADTLRKQEQYQNVSITPKGEIVATRKDNKGQVYIAPSTRVDVYTGPEGEKSAVVRLDAQTASTESGNNARFDRGFFPKSIEKGLNTGKELGGKDGTGSINRNDNSRNPILGTSSSSNLGLIQADPVAAQKDKLPFIERKIYDLSKKSQELETAYSRGEKLNPVTTIYTGLLLGAARKAQFVKNLITSPLKTSKETAIGTYELGKNIVTGEGVSDEFSKRLKTGEPGLLSGELTVEILSWKAQTKATSIMGKGFQTVNKAVNPKYVSYGNTNVQIVEGVTIPTELNKLKSFEGKTVPTTHATLSGELKPGVLIQPAPAESVGAFRAKIGQRNFYTSSPVEAPIFKIVDGKEIPVSYSSTPISPKYKPVLYGGYIGIGDGYSSSLATETTLLPKSAKGFIFRETEIKPTPGNIAKKNIKEVVKYQTENPGTYVAAENIKGRSVEGQFTTSAGTEGNPLIKIESAEGELQGKFTYYNLKKQVPNILGGEKTPTPVKKTWDFLTSENKKVKFYETKFTEVEKSSIPADRVQERVIVDKFQAYGSNSKSIAGASKNIPLTIVSERKEPMVMDRSVSSSVESSQSSSKPLISSSLSLSKSSERSSSASRGSSPSISSGSISSSPSSPSKSISSSGFSSSPLISSSSGSSSRSSGGSSSSAFSSSSSGSSGSSGSSSTGSSYFTGSSSIPLLSSSKDSKKKKKEKYKARVRRQGIFRDIGTFDTPEEAFLSGKVRVSTTAGASLQIVDEQDRTTPELGRLGRMLLSRNQFYQSEKEPNVFIERREQRIKSRGELLEITYRGLDTLKRRKASKKSSGGFNL